MSAGALRLVREGDSRTQIASALLDRPVQMPLHRGAPAPRDVGQDLDEHLQLLGPRPGATGHRGDALCALLDEVGLSGRGGGHFFVAHKWRTALYAGGGGTVVANAAESEPASAKDAVLVSRRPHLVLDGLVSTGEAIGATDHVVWLHAGDRGGHRALARALAERRSAGLSEPAIRLVVGPDSYLSGESSAILRSLAGGPALPAFRRTPAAVDGLGGRPALVHNVETLARIALVARSGADGYRPSSLFTVVGPDHRTVIEADPSWTLVEVVAAAGVPVETAVLVGGYGGSWLSWTPAAGLGASEAAAREAGVSLGAGVIAPLAPGGCGLAHTAAIARYLAASSARQCGPCLFGLPAIASVLTRLALGQAGRADLRRLDRFIAQVDGRGGCHHPDGVVRMARSALSVFAADVQAHRRRRPCVGAALPVAFPLPVPD